MSKHTPGPWVIEWPDEDEQWSVYHDDRELHDPHAYVSSGDSPGWSKFVSVVVLVQGEPDVVGKANACLIAAAPDLLELAHVALKKLGTVNDAYQREHRQDMPEIGLLIDDLRHVIAKAEGLESEIGEEP